MFVWWFCGGGLAVFDFVCFYAILLESVYCTARAMVLRVGFLFG